MPGKPLDEFAEMLMTRIRDKAILDWDKIAGGQMKGTHADKIRGLLAMMSEPDRQIFLRLMPHVVDTTLHHLLWTVEQDKRVTVSMRSADGSSANVAEASDGLPGELYGVRGWIARFSGQRHEDPGRPGMRGDGRD